MLKIGDIVICNHAKYGPGVVKEVKTTKYGSCIIRVYHTHVQLELWYLAKWLRKGNQ